ncbi:unnamed protein product [Calicophoron daubneyi]|uniref:Uncharacterized protein n=1 Tax=Calicophoron daubneyi TaxID=300641 RepID=A0AAV2SZZ5_CALDB
MIMNTQLSPDELNCEKIRLCMKINPFFSYGGGRNGMKFSLAWGKKVPQSTVIHRPPSSQGLTMSNFAGTQRNVLNPDKISLQTHTVFILTGQCYGRSVSAGEYAPLITMRGSDERLEFLVTNTIFFIEIAIV